MLAPGQVADYLRELLAIPLLVGNTGVWSLPAGPAFSRHVVSSPKLILVHEGVVAYQLKNMELTLRSGMMLYRPALTAALWRVLEPCRLLYCECSVPADMVHGALPNCHRCADGQSPTNTRPTLAAKPAHG